MDVNLQELADVWLKDFLAAAKLAGMSLSKTDFTVEILEAAHKPTQKQKGYAAVYVFIYEERYLKVGRAGSNSNARYYSQHYTGSAQSTLSGSLQKHSLPWLPKLDASEAKDWICNNTSRINFLLHEHHGPFAIGLLEAFLHCRLQPIFEGFESQRNDGNERLSSLDAAQSCIRKTKIAIDTPAQSRTGYKTFVKCLNLRASGKLEPLPSAIGELQSIFMPDELHVAIHELAARNESDLVVSSFYRALLAHDGARFLKSELLAQATEIIGNKVGCADCVQQFTAVLNDLLSENSAN